MMKSMNMLQLAIRLLAIRKFPTKLPTFSRNVESYLQYGDFWNNDSERGQFISELAIFFYTNNIALCKSCHYKVVVLTLFSNYVKFKDAIVKLCDIENIERTKNNQRMIQPWVLKIYLIVSN